MGLIKNEYFDVYDSNFKKMGYKIQRGKPLKKGEYHLVVEVITITLTGKILVTKRHPNKHYPLCYEFTGGSVLAGEVAIKGALRELREETGLITDANNLNYLGTIVYKETIYNDYLYVIDDEKDIILQDGETIAYRYVDLEKFPSFMDSHEFVPSAKKRYNAYYDQILEIVAAKKCS